MADQHYFWIAQVNHRGERQGFDSDIFTHQSQGNKPDHAAAFAELKQGIADFYGVPTSNVKFAAFNYLPD